MRRLQWFGVAVLGVALAAAMVLTPMAAEKPEPAASDKEGEAVKWAPAVEPKPLSENVEKGLKWLVAHQLECGGWGQGEESAQMQGSSRIYLEGARSAAPDAQQQIDVPAEPRSKPGERAEQPATENQPAAKPKEIPSVADTCMAALALIRSGTTPAEGPRAKNVAAAVRFVCDEIEQSDDESLYITDTRGTRVQSKLGPYIDTFMAALLLPEVVDTMPSKQENQRVEKALAKVLKKMEKNQRADGTWSDQGWAATLSQGAAVKAFNRAAQQPAVAKYVDENMRKKAEQQAQAGFDRQSGKFAAKGSAGVELYAASSNLSALSDSVNTNQQREAEAQEDLANAKDEKTREQAKEKLDRFREAKADRDAAQDAVIQRLDDKNFIAGFGNNGGEEFLSYMNIGESLVVDGGDKWKSWDKSITENLNRVQNEDGSWSGHHCITGRTFCTSAALLVLMVDRAPFPVSREIKRK